MKTDTTAPPEGVTRRTFIKTTAAATVGLSAGLMASESFAYAAGSDRLRVGLVGCGGRGTGAARDAVMAAEGVEIVAMGDLFEDRLEQSRAVLRDAIGEALKVTDATAFTGFDNYRHVIDSDIDMVILATPPGFRPMHLRYAVEAGRHVFAEKPVAVDAVGVRSVLETSRLADEKGLSIVAGTLYRRQPSFVEAIRRIHDGLIGEIVSAQEYYMTGPVWLRPRQPGMSDMEWQCRNWYYFTWLSGDHIVEQFVHNLDVVNWVLQAWPEKALGMGGRLVRVDPSYGHIYDHFSVEYEYPGGVRVEAKCRQMENTTRRITNRIVGTKGVADLHTDRSLIRSHDGAELFSFPERGNNAYVQEHADLIAAIRENEPVNEAEQIALSTLTGILGRESAYTGLELTWDDVLQADLDLVPASFSFRDLPMPAVAQPGVTPLNRAPFRSTPPAMSGR
ncbi:MAG: gfo/Idh/MocA family oxidoreductase [Bacteroidetes bacterium]|nr:MAG: gfo/Idh/MocA family oxidoreductase [Bacteroidota bacterium]